MSLQQQNLMICNMCTDVVVFFTGARLLSFLSLMQRRHPESHEQLGQDVQKRYIQMKSLEMYSLLDQMQTCMSHHSSSLSNIKPHYRFIAQTQRLSRRMEKEKSSEKIRGHVNWKRNTELAKANMIFGCFTVHSFILLKPREYLRVLLIFMFSLSM